MAENRQMPEIAVEDFPARTPSQPYLLNAWYACAFGSEIGTTHMLARTLLDQPVVLFRDGEGKASAMIDRCPHRFAPLHMGELADGIVECRYHGLRFDAAGRCVHNPHGSDCGERAMIRSFPTAERFGLVWFWPGAPERADPALLPDLGGVMDDEPHALASGYMRTPAHYELITDNLLDLSHADYLHRTTIGTGGAMSRLKPEIGVEDGRLTALWSYSAPIAQPLFRPTMRNPEGPARQSFEMTWRAPANMFLKVTARDEDSPPEADAIYNTAHLLTPEHERSTHYFILGRRNWDKGNAELNAMLRSALMAAFEEEDWPMLQGVQERMGTADLWSLRPLVLPCDTGPILARRLLRKRIVDEDRAARAAA